ncbi:MAG TPA: glycosyltransferase family 4 protein [Flavobacterium sp.]|nr:glycosyltransferase family 4 protein [Flavobacterium sp.]
MKLLYITNGINGSGGLERVLSIKGSCLAEYYNYEVTILCLNDAHINPFYTFSEKIKMLSIPVSGNPLTYFLSYKKGIQKMVQQVDPDIISVCDDGLKGFLIPKLIGSKITIVYERHVSKEIEMNEGLSIFQKILIKSKWKLMEKLASNFSKFIVLTKGNTNEWKSIKNIEIIANPLSFYPEQSSTLQNKKVIAVGKQSYQKGYDRLLQSWQLVNKRFPEWQLEIYGTIAPEFKLEQQAKELNIDQAVFFFPPEKNIQSKYLDSSIYVMSSRYEGFGMVLIEAMACGVPCVSFDCNYGPSDIIENGVDGFIVANDDYYQLANSLLKLISDKELRIEMGTRAKDNVQRFLPVTIVQVWDNLFKKLVQC